MYYFRYHIGDFIASTNHLDLREEAVYRRLLDLCYLSEKALSPDLKGLARAIRARGEEELVGAILEEFFIRLEDGSGWIHKRVEEELAIYRDKSAKASESAGRRWNRSKPGSGSDSVGNANAYEAHSEGIAEAMLTNNHKPITNNHKSGSLSFTIDPLFLPSADIVETVAEAATVTEKEVIEFSIGFAAHYSGKTLTRTKLISNLIKWVDRERRFRDVR